MGGGLLSMLEGKSQELATSQAEYHEVQREESAQKASVEMNKLRGEDVGATLLRCLEELRREAPLDGCEVEARIGMLCEEYGEVGKSEAPRRHLAGRRGCGAVRVRSGEARFVSGVSRAEANEVRNVRAQKAASRVSKEPRTVAWVESTFSSDMAALDNVRLVVPPQHDKPHRLEVKSTIAKCDIGLPSANYDLRIQLAVERDERSLSEVARKELGKTSGVIGPWTSHRLKQRVSTTVKGWRIDQTTVTKTTFAGLTTEQAVAVGRNPQQHSSTAAAGRGSTTLHEIEVEMTADATARWLHSNDSTALVAELQALLSWLNPIEAVDTRRDPSTETSSAQREAALAQMRESLHRKEAGSRKHFFPGSMPIGFCRKHIPQTQRPGAYAVAEKSDGERRLLVVFKDGDEKRAALIDRTDDARLVPLSSNCIEALDVGVVLDGEIVHNLELRIPVFLVFDVLHDGLTDLTRSTFDLRFFHSLRHRLARAMAVPCPGIDDAMDGDGRSLSENDERIRAMVANEPGAVLLVPKRFSRPKNLQARVLSRIRSDVDCGGQVKFGSRVFREDAARCHLTDGLVFVPIQEEYVAGTDRNLLKWKWADGFTVDLEIRGGGKGGGLNPCAIGDDDDTVDCSKHVALAPHDEARLRADLNFYSTIHQDRPLVAELSLEPYSGLWEYHAARPDKTKGNHIDVFVATLLLHAESPEEHELEYRLQHPSPEKDDWDKALARAVKAATSPWIESFSKTQQRPYWFDKHDTKRTTWERPKEFQFGNLIQ